MLCSTAVSSTLPLLPTLPPQPAPPAVCIDDCVGLLLL